MSAYPEKIRIEDLEKPVFPPEIVQAVAEILSQAPDQYTEEAVLDAAVAQTGLDDFGATDFRERLQNYLASLEEDRDLSPGGRFNVFAILVRYAANRLRVEDLYRRHPEIAQVEIRQPIIIAGLPRSGTTHMLNLISADHSLRHLPYWESLEPVPVPGEELADGEEDPRRRRCREGLEMQDVAIPHFKRMHEMTPDHAHEEIELMGIDFSTMLFENYALVPAWRDYFLAHDQHPHYQYMKKVLQLLQWLRGPQRWILKSPQHMEQIPALLHTFPDATIVFPHRDPVAILVSLSTMLSYTGRTSRDPVRPEQVSAYWFDRLRRMLQACVDTHHLLPPERTCDVVFDDFMRDNMGIVQQVYAMAGHEPGAQNLASVRAYAQGHRRGRFGGVIYEPDVLGVDIPAARATYRFYTERFGIREEY